MEATFGFGESIFGLSSRRALASGSPSNLGGDINDGTGSVTDVRGDEW